MAIPVILKVFRGDDHLRTERFTRDIIKIGRLSSAHLCLDDERISRIHSVIEVGPDGRISIIDMGSAEGTFVNGKRVSKGPLADGDEIKLGGLRILLERGDVNQAMNQAVDVVMPAAPPAEVHAKSNGHATTGHGNAAVAVTPPPEPESKAPPASTGAARPRRAAMALARPIDEQPPEEGAPDLGVEVRVLWGETLLDAGTFVAPAKPILVGEGPRCQFRLSGPDLPAAEFPILRFETGEYRFVFARGMRGGIEDAD